MPNDRRVYLAGPDVFLADAGTRADRLKRALSVHGLAGVFPLDAELDLGGLSPPEQGFAIHRANEELIGSCDAVLANLSPFRGPSADPGTVYEVGVAVALGKLVVGYSDSDEALEARTEAWLERLGTPARDRDGAEALREDPDGLAIESFALPDNLMIPGGIAMSGGTIVTPAEAGPEALVDVAALTLAERLVARTRAR